MRTLLALEMKRRMRGTAWWILFASWIVIIGGISTLFIVGAHASVTSEATSARFVAQAAFSVLLCVQLLMLCVVVPAFSGTVINGDRESGVLAQLQITLLSARTIVLTKWLAAALVSTVFFIVTSPALFYFMWLGKLPWSYWVITPLVIILEIFVIAAIGTGLSGVVRRPIFSVLYAYLVIALLIVGGPTIAVVSGLATSHVQTVTLQQMADSDATTCAPVQKQRRVYHWERYWWLITTNPIVIASDALPKSSRTEGLLTTSVKDGLSYLQNWQEWSALDRNDCIGDTLGDEPEERIPGWPIGVGIHVVIGVGLLHCATRRTRTPITRMPKGQRIA